MNKNRLNRGNWRIALTVVTTWRSRLLNVLILFIVVLLSIAPLKSVASETKKSSIEDNSCPEDLQQLTASLLKDLPGYSNRVIQRTQRANRQAGIRNFIIAAGKREFEPLDLPRIQYNRIDDRNPEQIFFTVLERQYNNGKVSNIQTYHWLFLTQTNNGWQPVMMFSRFGNSDSSQPPAPPKETTNGIIGQGVQLWLRDCRAGSLSTSN